jgi:thymidylate synthase ThyX
MCVESSRYTLDKMLKEYGFIYIDKKTNDDVLESEVFNNFVYPDYETVKEHFKQYSDYENYIMQLKGVNIVSLNFMKQWFNYGLKADLYKYGLIENKRTSFVWKIDLKNFLHFIDLRTDKNAHFEIRYIANLMLDEVKKDDFLRELI